MLQIQQGSPARNCQGITRRSALKAGFLGLLGLSLPDLLRLRAASDAANDTSVILLWLDGGPSQLESYDPKPEAPAEYRGPFGAIDTNVPGIRISESLPCHARHADKMAFVRSLHHDNGDHFAAAHWMLTGRFGSNAADQAQKYPSVGSFAARVRGANQPGLPAYVGLPAAQSVYLFPGYQGSAYLGPAYNPFDVDRVQKYLGATGNTPIRKPRCLENFAQAEPGQMQTRRDLLGGIDTIRRDLDQSGTMDTLDRYQQQAIDMILGGKAREAFDIEREDPKMADRYGLGPWGRYTLMARRLVEAGVTFVTVDMPHWDDHSKIKEGHGPKLLHMDRAVGALLEDLDDRGLSEKVLVVVMGEFGRTPKLNTGQPGIPVPGRDHWGNAISAMLAGGGLRGGQVVGATNAKAEHPVDHPLKPADLLATVYHVLGIDPNLSFKDHTGRPIPILDEAKPIAEVI
ncbi:hypothetical protein AYO44_07160 [Planctomycetaceae bacterium SCGC AG-212-F19]|nr:hypothetical protein AYO44_07160 [Planctomycetaceae bacterium SCGC AG-212-F19]